MSELSTLEKNKKLAREFMGWNVESFKIKRFRSDGICDFVDAPGMKGYVHDDAFYPVSDWKPTEDDFQVKEYLLPKVNELGLRREFVDALAKETDASNYSSITYGFNWKLLTATPEQICNAVLAVLEGEKK